MKDGKMKCNLLKLMVFYVLFTFLALGVFACGNDEGEPGDYDGTCYDCDLVCAGSEGAVLADCTDKCLECQGYSDCFGWMDGRYEGADTPMAEWSSISCDEIAATD